MKILIIGSGGREHAIAWRLHQSERVTEIWVAPGNGGMNAIAKSAAIDTSNHADIVAFTQEKAIDLVVIGPEAELVDGLVDHLQAAAVRTFGPSKKAAILEESKEFTKQFCDSYHIPTAAYAAFEDAQKAKAYIDKVGVPLVVKADGLAAGKGVIIAYSMEEAYEAVDKILGGQFGAAGNRIVIEEFLQGEELSFFALVNGEQVVALGSAQDHKAVGEGDTGPNTGGMGTYSPAPIMDQALEQKIMEEFIIPTAKGMVKEGRPYQGVLFAGLMITAKGPMLLEYNVRFGDPETQSLLSRLETDLLSLIEATIDQRLDEVTVSLSKNAALCVVMATNGYPGSYEKGSEIKGVGAFDQLDDIHIFHAGTVEKEGKFYANGGRVLGVTAVGSTILEAQKKAYQAVDQIDWPEGFCRRDIGWRAIQHAEKNAS